MDRSPAPQSKHEDREGTRGQSADTRLGCRALADAKPSESESLAAQASLEKADVSPGVSDHALPVYPRDAMAVLLAPGVAPHTVRHLVVVERKHTHCCWGLGLCFARTKGRHLSLSGTLSRQGAPAALPCREPPILDPRAFSVRQMSQDRIPREGLSRAHTAWRDRF